MTLAELLTTPDGWLVIVLFFALLAWCREWNRRHAAQQSPVDHSSPAIKAFEAGIDAKYAALRGAHRDESAPRTSIEGMPFRAVGEGPTMPTIEAEESGIRPLPDGGKLIEGL